MRSLLLLFFICVGLFFISPSAAHAADNIQLNLNMGSSGNANLSINLQLLILFTILSLAPGIVMMTTCFIRIIIVFSFLRTALTLQQPPNQVIVALALFLTAFIMAPTFSQINKEALAPMQAGEISSSQAFEKASGPLKDFMLKQVHEKELQFFVDLKDDQTKYEKPEDIPVWIVIPAFMLSEIKTAFQMGLLILLPFLVIDMLVASILMALGMFMLPPPTVALPFKLMVFVLVDGWVLVVRSVVQSFQG